MADIFAKLGDIKGESADAHHKDEIEVLSFSWGFANIGGSPAGGSGVAGKPTFQDLAFVHTIDKASPQLMAACANGTHLKGATITHREGDKGKQEFLIITMTDVLITSVNQGSSTGQPGTESVTLTFARVDLEYKAKKPDGSLDEGTHFTYDLTGHKDS